MFILCAVDEATTCFQTEEQHEIIRHIYVRRVEHTHTHIYILYNYSLSNARIFKNFWLESVFSIVKIKNGAIFRRKFNLQYVEPGFHEILRESFQHLEKFKGFKKKKI